MFQCPIVESGAHKKKSATQETRAQPHYMHHIHIRRMDDTRFTTLVFGMPFVSTTKVRSLIFLFSHLKT